MGVTTSAYDDAVIFSFVQTFGSVVSRVVRLFYLGLEQILYRIALVLVQTVGFAVSRDQHLYLKLFGLLAVGFVF